MGELSGVTVPRSVAVLVGGPLPRSVVERPPARRGRPDGAGVAGRAKGGRVVGVVAGGGVGYRGLGLRRGAGHAELRRPRVGESLLRPEPVGVRRRRRREIRLQVYLVAVRRRLLRHVRGQHLSWRADDRGFVVDRLVFHCENKQTKTNE